MFGTSPMIPPTHSSAISTALAQTEYTAIGSLPRKRTIAELMMTDLSADINVKAALGIPATAAVLTYFARFLSSFVSRSILCSERA